MDITRPTVIRTDESGQLPPPESNAPYCRTTIEANGGFGTGVGLRLEVEGTTNAPSTLGVALGAGVGLLLATGSGLLAAFGVSTICSSLPSVPEWSSLLISLALGLVVGTTAAWIVCRRIRVHGS